MNILHFKNFPNKTPFAPSWDYFLCEENILSELNISDIKNAILKNEKDIVQNNKYIDDWGTGLGENSLTSRSNYYNLLEWPETNHIKPIIKNTYNTFLSSIGLPPEKTIYVQCWANVLRNSQIINTHRHWDSIYTYLGGHICIQQHETSTYYKHPFSSNDYVSKNESGKITLFPSWVEHGTTQHTHDQERITIAFDIITQIVLDEDIAPPMRPHWVAIRD
jgi:hypothetical protein